VAMRDGQGTGRRRLGGRRALTTFVAYVTGPDCRSTVTVRHPVGMVKRRIDGRRLGLSMVVAAALAFIIYGFSLAERGGNASTITDPAVERVVPPPGSLVLRQSTIIVDLEPGYRGVLFVNGQEIPTFDLVGGDSNTTGAVFDAVFDPAQNTISFTPRTGATVEELPAGENRITAVFWKMSESRESARSASWTIRVS
jgi:hypothetical protein